MSPVSSASAMNSTGSTRPRSRSRQRSSASARRERAGVQIGLWLEMQLEARLRQRPAQRPFELQPAHRAAAQRRAVDDAAVAPLAPGLVPGERGVPDQHLGLVAVVRKHGQPRVTADDDAVVAQIDRVIEPLQEFAGQGLGVGGPRQRHDDHGQSVVAAGQLGP